MFNVREILLESVKQAEELFGSRDRSFILSGVGIWERSRPEAVPYTNGADKLVHVYITENCRFDENRAIFQISHEVIHCLFPKFYGQTTVFEEGMATWFSQHVKFSNYQPLGFGPNDAAYEEAMRLFAELHEMNTEGVKDYRLKDEDLKSLSLPALKEVWPGISESHSNLVRLWSADIEQYLLPQDKRTDSPS